jgi:hypothetical protein
MDFGSYKYFNRYIDGYQKNILDDRIGNFYIIHPFELKIKRNIMNNIISYDKKQLDEIPKTQNELFINKLINKLYYIPFKNEYEDKTIDIQYYKTEYYLKINKLLSIFKMNEKDMIVLFIASGYDLLFEACEVITLINTINYHIPALIKKDSNKEFREIFQSDSDIISLYRICKLMKNRFENLLVYKTLINKSTLKTYKNEYNNIVKLYRSKKYNEIIDSLNCMNFLYNNGYLDSDKGFLYWLKLSNKFKKLLKNDIKNYKNDIINFCNKNYLNDSIIFLN